MLQVVVFLTTKTTKHYKSQRCIKHRWDFLILTYTPKNSYNLSP
mgnify:CR=1 FL=1